LTASDPPRPPSLPQAGDGRASSGPGETAAGPRGPRDVQPPLTAWGRYRALTGALAEARFNVERAELKARLALMVLGALEVVPILLATRSDVAATIPESLRPWVGGYLVLYVVLGAYFFLQGVEWLRPQSRPHDTHQTNGRLEDQPRALRIDEEVRLGQINDELALQVQALVRSHRARYGPLRRTFVGLQVMTTLAASVLVLSACCLFFGAPAPAWPAAAGGAFLPPPGRAAAARPGDPAADVPGQGTIRADQPSLIGLKVLSEPERIAIDTRQPSGVAFHPALGHMFVVGDEKRLLELDAEGRSVLSVRLNGSVRDLVVHAPTGSLLLLSAEKAELAWFDARSGVEVTRWRLDVEAILGQLPTTGSPGFQGLAFREVPGYPGGGLFYLVHQRGPTMIVALSLDPSSSGGRLGESAVAGRFVLEGEDLTAATYVPALDRLLVISDARDRALVLRMDGGVEAEVVLPGRRQEGLALDGEGRLWVADERAGLLRFPGALQALEKVLAGDAAENDP